MTPMATAALLANGAAIKALLECSDAIATVNTPCNGITPIQYLGYSYWLPEVSLENVLEVVKYGQTAYICDKDPELPSVQPTFAFHLLANYANFNHCVIL